MIRRHLPFGLSICLAFLCCAAAAGQPPRLRPPPPPLPPPPAVILVAAPNSSDGDRAVWINVSPGTGAPEDGRPGIRRLPAPQLDGRDTASVMARIASLDMDRSQLVYLTSDSGSWLDLAWGYLWMSVAGFEQLRVVPDLGTPEAQPVPSPPLSAPQLPAVSAQPMKPRDGNGQNQEILIDIETASTLYGQAGVEVLDLREAADWEAYEFPPGFRAGHIPHSLPFEAASFFQELSSWSEPLQLRARLAKLGPREVEPVDLRSTFVLVGQDANDRRIGLAYLLLRSLGIEVQVLQGGWKAWAARSDLPRTRVIDAEEVHRLLEADNPGLTRDSVPNNLVFLDLRESWYFEEAHLPGATFLSAFDFQEQIEEVLTNRWPGIDRSSTRMLLYCFGPSCTRSRRCATWGSWIGFRELLWFRGGIDEWEAASYPLFGTRIKGSTAAGRAP